MHLLAILLPVLLNSALQVHSEDNGILNAATNALYRCGIRKRFGVQLIHSGRTAELGQWPWHSAVYQGPDYKCGGTLIDQRHVLTSAHCVVDSNRRALRPRRVSVQLGKHDLDVYPEHAQVINVSEVHVHPEFSQNKNDIALLVLSREVRFSEFVIPICLEGIQVGAVEELVNQRGWVVGWGETENDRVSKQLKTASMPVVSNTECVQNDPDLFGRFISTAIYCASDRNGTSVCRGDSGGGMYFLAGDHWELRGITSFAGLSETGSCDTRKYVVFTNVAFFYRWIKQLTDGASESTAEPPKRISEIKCKEYGKYAAKQSGGVCMNYRSPHTIAIIDSKQRHICSGSIISEKFILTRAPNIFDLVNTDIDFEHLRVRIGNQPDRRVLREIIHPNYDESSLHHHVMLLEMETPLSFSRRFPPACLANKATENLFDTLLLNGYRGHVDSTTEFFESAANRVITNELCNALIRTGARQQNYTVSSDELCAVDRNPRAFFGGGIAGGPLQTVNTRNCMFTLVGITEVFPASSASSNSTDDVVFTNVFARVTTYLDWIERVVWGDEMVEAMEGEKEAPREEFKDFYFPDDFERLVKRLKTKRLKNINRL